MNFALTFIMMFAFWILLSGRFDLFHLTLGVISCLIVSFISHDLLFKSRLRSKALPIAVRFILYIPWLLIQIVDANIHVAYVALHPRMKRMIDPRVVRFTTRLKGDMARVTLANSITLTPGTITVMLKNGEFVVHALTRKVARGLPGMMEKRIARTFDED